MLKPYKLPVFKSRLVRDGFLPSHLPLAPISGTAQVVSIFMHVLRALPHEELHMLMINSLRRPIGAMRISQGGQYSTAVSPRDILRPAITAGASGIVLAHNHPSGDSKPSEDDLSMTKLVEKTCDAVGIVLLDHIVVCPERGEWTSIFEFRVKEE